MGGLLCVGACVRERERNGDIIPPADIEILGRVGIASDQVEETSAVVTAQVVTPFRSVRNLPIANAEILRVEIARVEIASDHV